RPYVPIGDDELDAYCAALLRRFENPGIEHRLDQIALDGLQKLRVRVLPVVRAERSAGRVPTAACRILPGWAHLQPEDITAALGRLDPALPDDAELVAAITRERIAP